MSKFIIVTDSCSDLPQEYLTENNIEYIPLSYHLGDKEYTDDFGGSLSYRDFYNAMKNGEGVKTSQPSPQSFYDVFHKSVKNGFEVLYIGVSTGLSGTFNSANIAKKMMGEEFPDAKITLINTLTASMGLGLLVMQAVELKKQNKILDEIADHINSKIATFKTFMAVNDLKFLRQGGRISAFQYTVASLLNVNIMLYLDKEGKVGLLDKVRGRKKAILHFVQSVKNNVTNPQDKVLAISHGDALEDAMELKEAILKEVQFKSIVIGSIGPVVGAYGGPGALAVFFSN